MKMTKLLLKTVTALGLLGGISSFAQTNVVYSVNMVGFQKVSSNGLLTPGSNLKMVSTPFLAGDTDIQVAIGEQLTPGFTAGTADNLIFYSPGVGYETYHRLPVVGVANLDNKWVDGNTDVVTRDILPGSGFWIRNQQSSTQEVVFVGEVISETNVTVSIATGLQILSFPYSSDFDLPNDDTLRLSGAQSGNTAGTADNIILWDAENGLYVTYYLFPDTGVAPGFDNKWLNSDTSLAISEQIPSGTAFWYSHKGAGYTWSPQIPY